MNTFIRADFKAIPKGTGLSNEEINEQLKDTASQAPYLSLEARRNKEKEVFFYQEEGKIVKKIKIDLINKGSIPQLPSLQAKYLNQTDHPDLRSSFISDTLSILQDHGYTNPFIQLEARPFKQNLEYRVKIKRGKACQLSLVEKNFKNLSSFTLDIQEGDDCNIHEINKKLKKFLEKIKKKGYQKAILTLSSLVYNEDKTSAKLSIGGQIGEAFSYKVVETKRTGFLDKFLWFKIRKHPLDDIEGKYTTDASLSHKIREFYLNRGYYDVFVHPPLTQEGKKNKNTILYKVDPGSFYTIGSISIIGNQSFSRKKLLKINNKNYLDFNKKRYYSEKEFDDFVESLYSFYYQQGFWNVKIQKVNSINKEDLKIDVTIRIKENKKHVLHNLKIKGNKKIPLSLLQKKTSLKKGDSLSPEKIQETIKNLKEIYKQNSFFDVQVKTEFSPKESTLSKEKVNLTLHITERRLYRIQKISLSGLEKTKEQLVKKYLDFKEGDLYSLENIESSRARLLDLGIFNSVNFSRRDLKNFDTEEQLVDIHVEFKESNRGNISFGPGFDLKSGFLYQMDIFYKNPFGRAHKFLLSTSVSEEKDQPYITSSDNKGKKSFQLGTSIGVTHSNPHFFHRNLKQTLSAFYKRGSFSDESSSLWVSTVDLKLQFELDLSFFIKRSKIITYYQFLRSKEEGISRNRIPLLSTPDSTYSIFGAGFILDYRDNPTLPQRGVYLEGTLDVASQFLYGDFFYLKNKLLFSYYYKLYENYVLAFHYSDESYHFVERLSNKEVGNFLPRAQRLFINSPDRVRGFKEDLGPYSSDNTNSNSRKALGGTNSLVYKLELRAYKLYSIFGLTLFLDGGNTFFPKGQSEHIEDYYQEVNKKAANNFAVHDLSIRPRLYEAITAPSNFFGNLYHSVGLSISLALPIGILNFSLAYPISEPKDSTWDRINYDSPFKNIKLELNIGTYF